MVPIAVMPRPFWTVTPRWLSGAPGKPEERDAVDAVAHVRGRSVARDRGSSSVLDQLHAELLLVPRHGLGMSRHTSARWLKPRSSNSALVCFPVVAMSALVVCRIAHHQSATVKAHPLVPKVLPTPSGFRIQLARWHDSHQVPKADAEAPIVLSMYARLFGDRDPVAERVPPPHTWRLVDGCSPTARRTRPRVSRLRSVREPEPQDQSHTGASSDRRARAGWSGAVRVLTATASRASALGYSEEKIEALKAWQVSELFSPLERALLAYTDALVLGFGASTKRSSTQCASTSTTKRSSSSPTITMMYTMHAVISRAVHLEFGRARRPDRRDRRHPTTTCRRTSDARSASPPTRVRDRRAARTRDARSRGTETIELGNFIAGPFAGQLLGDYGADVIKVESPGDGDPMRHWGVTIDGDSLWWPTIARNKRSIVLDLRQPVGRTIAARLAEQCDVVLENFRPGTLERWGLDYDTLSARQPEAGDDPHQRVRPRLGRSPSRPASAVSAKRWAASRHTTARSPTPLPRARRHQSGRRARVRCSP